MEGAGLVENFTTGLFENARGQFFVRCDFNPAETIWIDVTGDCWSTSYAGTICKLDWRTIVLPSALKKAIGTILVERMKFRSPRYLEQFGNGLRAFITAASHNDIRIRRDFSSLKSASWLLIWTDMPEYARSYMRSLYHELADKDLCGADPLIAAEMQTWKARTNIQSLKQVLQWDPEFGALTSAESELYRQILVQAPGSESDRDCAIRVFGWTLNETLKRPIQILSMKEDALWPVGDEPGPYEFFLRIPKAKNQTGRPFETWPITEALGHAIQDYSTRPGIRELQARHNRLFVMPGISDSELNWTDHGQVPGWLAGSNLRSWVQRHEILSPRTQRPLKVTPIRIRHTGATGMAMQGVPRDEIQYILEHDSPFSAQAYIDAVGSELVPMIERSDRAIGEIFSQINEAFFKGKVVKDVRRRPIQIPVVVETPAVVGSCGKSGSCNRHPFWGCYDGCPHFLAWCEGDHQRARRYVASELKRWNVASGEPERSKAAKDFDRIYASISEVIAQIDAGITKRSEKE